MNADLKIVEIVSVVDTRQYEEVDERWVPIAGSGTTSTCERCGRGHEVHAHVKLADGSIAIVGTGCMGADSLNKKARGLASRAGSIRKVEAEISKLGRLIAELAAATAEVDALPVPAVTDDVKTFATGATAPRVRVGDASGYVMNGVTRERAIEVAVRNWKRNRLTDRGITAHHGHAHTYLEAAQLRLKKLRA